MRKKRFLSFLMVLVLMLTQVGVFPVFAKELPKAPINLLKAVEKNQFLLNEEFTINYKIQPQPIQADKILPESYLKDKEIVLVMDTSGSMKEEIRYNQENDHQSIFEEKYAPKNVSVNLRDNHNGQDIYDYTIQFSEPSAGENIDTRYLIFYSEREIDVVENWIKNLNSSNLKYLYNDSHRALGINSDNSKYRALPDWLSDIDGYSFSGNKSYNVYVATINELNNGKVIGLTKAKNTIGRTTNKKPKIDVMKEVAKNFLEKLKDDNNSGVKVALVPYASYAQDNNFDNKDFAKLSDFTQYKSLTDKIEALSADGGTNIGDGLRKAFYKFSDSDEDTRRYVILMTDGEPTFHSYIEKKKNKKKKKKKELYFGDGSYPNDYKYEGGGHYATEEDKLYANKVAEDLVLNGGKEIESFMIAFSNGADQNILKDIANSANGYYKEAVDGNALDEVYQKLAQQIQSDLPIHGINFEETFPQGINIVQVSEGLEFSGQTVTGDIGSISYILNEETNQFEAEPFEFFITLKGTEIGDYNLDEKINDKSTSYIDYKDIDGTDGHKAFPGVNISVYEIKPPDITASLIENESNEEKYELSLTIDEPSKIEVFKADGNTIWPEDKTGENANKYHETLAIDIDKADLNGKVIIIKAVDKSNNETEETVPLINLKPIEILGWNQNYQTIKGKLELETEANSTITSIKINGATVAEDRLLTKEGKYSQEVDFEKGSNKIEITVKNKFNNTSTESVNKVIEKKGVAPEVNIKVSDASGERNTYEVSAQNADKRVDEILDSNITLKGDAFANINVKGKDVDFFKYQFLNSSEIPSYMPITGWESIDLNEELVNEDVVTEKQGFLNQRSYDVSHLGTMSDRNKWNNPEEVFKNPFDATTYKAAMYSSNPNEYGQWEEYLKSDGSKSKRWTSNSIFMNNMNVSGSNGNENYKESSKFWGYIKVPTTGNYIFGAVSDDGCRGYITVKGETKPFVDMFKVQSATSGSTNNVYELEAGKYYPIYLEYFNWGGSAAFEIKYSDNNGSSWKRVPQNYFYPSKNITPGEYATSIFTGSKGVKFPSESGDYYIAFRTGKGTDITREGIYGPFTVNGKSTINVSKVVDGGNIVNEKNKFILEYTINPADIEPRSTFKENGEFKQKIYLNNVQLQDEYPDSIEIKTGPDQSNIVKNGQKITVQIKKIEYNLITKNGQKIYSAEPIKIQVYLSAKELGNYILSEIGKSIITFTDVNEANRQMEFEPVAITVEPRLMESVSVLEIQPGRTFELNKEMFSKITKDVENVNLVQMSINEFIGTIDKVNGNYDIIYIGNVNNQYKKKTKINSGYGYYSETDITDKKAKELIEFIESGQLTIVDSSIVQEGNNRHDQLKETKLYKNLAEERERLKDIGERFVPKDENNVKLISNIINENIESLYYDCSKRPILNVKIKPKEYDGTDNSYEETKDMNFKFDLDNINITDDNPNKMTVKLYLDINGDGLFKDDELAEQQLAKLNGKEYLLTHRLRASFTGMMPWKLEVEDEITGSKAYETGYPAYKGQKLKVRVLQITPSRWNTLRLTNLNSLLKSDYYDIEITEIPINIFNNNYPNDVSYNRKTIKTELNGNYDMIVFGFGDSFGNAVVSDLKNPEAIEAVKQFINTGQSVMFTHDTAGPIDFYQDAPELTRNFKNIIGFTNDRTHAGSGAGQWDNPRDTESTYKINRGTITEYPYKLDDFSSVKNINNREEIYFGVSTTHQQYWELDLEDEDVVPWYILDQENSSSRYDPRGHYYTFTKGNLTYSGTGHYSGGPNSKEKKMFINTMIKAARNANHAPTLRVTNLDKNNIIAKGQQGLEFSFIANDIDGDLMSGEIYINEQRIKSYAEGEIQNNNSVNIQISPVQLQSLVGDNESFTVKIVVRDNKGAVAEKNENCIIKYLENPVLNMDLINNGRNYLVGDTARVSLKIHTQKTSDTLNTKIQNINFSMYDLPDRNEIEVVQGNWDLPNEITFNPEPSVKSKSKTFELKLKEKGNYEIKNKLEYEYNNFNLGKQTTPLSYPISVESGIIDINVLKSDDTAFGRVKVKVTKGSDGSFVIYDTDENGILSLINKPTDRYTFEIYNLDDEELENYIVKGGNSKVIDLSINNPVQKVNFELIDKTKIALELQSSGREGYLVGDTVNITLEATAYNEDENINTDISDIDYSMTTDSDDALEWISNKEWDISDIRVKGEEITYNNPPNNNSSDNIPPSKELIFKINNKPDTKDTVTVYNTLEYKYLNNIQGTSTAENIFGVKSGKIKVKVVDNELADFAGVTVKVTEKVTNSNGDTIDTFISQGETNEEGIYEINQHSGNYEVSVVLPEGMAVEGDNSREVVLLYGNPVPDIEDFKLINSTTIINNGMYINNKFVSDNKVVKGFDAHLAAEFKVYDKQPDIRLILDEEINKVQLKLYKVDSSRNLTAVNGNIEVFKVEESIEDGNVIENTTNLNAVNGKVDLVENFEGERSLKIEIPESTDVYNSYLLQYTVSQNATVGTNLEFNIKVNDLESPGHLVVVALPILD